MVNETLNHEHRPASAIHCANVSVSFPGHRHVLNAVNLDVHQGEIVALIGPSGCGKTTLLRVIAGLQSIDEGSVQIDPVAQAASGQIGFVFQQPALLPWLTTLRNVMLPLELTRWSNERQRRQTAGEILAAVQLDSALVKRPAELSGGMQMRASIARALVTRPGVLLLDEPFAALDEMLRGDLGRLLLELWQERRFTAVMVTHNISESILLSHRVAIMHRGALTTILENPLPWPRSPSQMRTPEFGRFFGEVSDWLRSRTLAPEPSVRGGAS